MLCPIDQRYLGKLPFCQQHKGIKGE